MFTTIISFLSALVVTVTSFFGVQTAPAALARANAAAERAAVSAPAPETGPASAARPGAQQDEGAPRKGSAAGWPFQGDPRLRAGLILATVSVSGQQPVAVLQALADGQSLAQIAAANGKSADDILAAFSETVKYLWDGRTQEAALAEAHTAWLDEAARQMVDQPGLAPAYPGLSELQSTIIAASVQVGSLERPAVKDGLRACRSLADLLTDAGQSGQAAVDAAMQRLNTRLDRLAAAGRLTADQRTAWSAGIETALTRLVTAPGLYLGRTNCK